MMNVRCAVLGITLAVAGSGCAQQTDSDLSSELTEGQAILEELREIRKLLEANPPGGTAAPAARPARPRRGEVSVAEGQVLGRADAPLTLVEFTDFECPFCSRFASTTFEQLKREYIDTGKLRLVSRDLPLAIHSNAMQAANAARCAGEQDHYWEMRDTLFGNNTQLDQESLIRYADDLNLDVAKFTVCQTSDKYGDEIRQDAADAGAVGITGTPSFVLGKTSGDRLEGAIIVGAQSFATFDTQIKALLAEG